MDRRAQYAQMLALEEAFVAAADLMAQALEAAPGWAAGWMMRADFLFKAGDLGGAIAAWQEAAVRDPKGWLGAQMQLAAHGVSDVRPAAQSAYVEALFDQYASQFEESLLAKLDYCVPEKLSGMVETVMVEAGIEGFARALDLGCGTGLMGERLRRSVSHLSGVDLSGAMVAEAKAKGIYDGVEQGELLSFLEQDGRIADLVTAADVFMYCPGLPPIVAAVARVLRPGGLFAFSIERAEGGAAQVLQASLRFAHSPDRVVEALVMHGFDILAMAEETIRTDRGLPVAGVLFVSRKPEPVWGGTAASSEDHDTSLTEPLLS